MIKLTVTLEYVVLQFSSDSNAFLIYIFLITENKL